MSPTPVALTTGAAWTPGALAYTVYTMRRYAYGVLLETSTLVIDRRTRAVYLTAPEFPEEVSTPRPFAAELLALWHRCDRATNAQDDPEYLGYDDSDRPRVYLERSDYAELTVPHPTCDRCGRIIASIVGDGWTRCGPCLAVLPLAPGDTTPPFWSLEDAPMPRGWHDDAD